MVRIRADNINWDYLQIRKMSAVNQRPRRTPRVSSRVKKHDKKDSVENNKKVVPTALITNSFEDISSDSSFDAGEFEVVLVCDWCCGVCGQEVRDSEEGVQCDGCRSWLHTQCGGISHHSYTQMVREEEEGKHCPWLCPGGVLNNLPPQPEQLTSSVNNTVLFRLQPVSRVPA